MEMLKCSGRYSICGETKPISEFHKASIFKDKPFGVDPTCKACRYERVKNRKNNKKETQDMIANIIKEKINAALYAHGIKPNEPKKETTLNERKNALKPFSIGEAPSGGYRIRYLKTSNSKKADIYLGSFSSESEEKVLRRAETLKNAFNEILTFNNINFNI